MNPFIAALLGLVEGLTEYLPVSSTGHLILVDELLGHSSEATKSFDIVIQLGAILAVMVHYRALLAQRVRGLLARDPIAIRLFSALVVAFVPTAILGLLLRKTIKAYLFGSLPVAGALIVGGILMIGVEHVREKRGVVGESGLETITIGRALVIGLGQSLAMWPGSSRSMCTIVAGQLTGLSTKTAAEFSFLLGLPTLGAATLYEGMKSHRVLVNEIGYANMAVGLVVSFFVAWAVIAAFIQYLGKRGLAPFGYYRIVLGLVVVAMALR